MISLSLSVECFSDAFQSSAHTVFESDLGIAPKGKNVTVFSVCLCRCVFNARWTRAILLQSEGHKVCGSWRGESGERKQA